MADTENKQEQENNEEVSDLVQAGPTSKWLTENGFDNEALEKDHLGIELIDVDHNLGRQIHYNTFDLKNSGKLKACIS